LTMQCRAGSSTVHEERWFFKVPGMVRRERGPDQVEICDRGKCWIKSGKEKPSPRPSWAYLPYLFFVENNVTGSRYKNLLESLNVDLKNDTMARFYHGRLAIIIGAKEWERDRPQFWVDKDEFLPLRLMAKEGSGLVEILWKHWGSMISGDWFPAVLEINIDGKQVERCDVEKVDANSPVSEELFKVPTT
jgi:hypothetical protein